MKNDRRKAFKSIAVVTGAVGVAATTPISKTARKVIEECNCAVPFKGPRGAYFTNAVVQTHDRGRMLFYKDLLEEKIVLINFMSIQSEAQFRTTDKLLKVQEILGDRLGVDYSMYSITTDPLVDSLQDLRSFAKDKGVREGWSFITSSVEIIEGLKQRFFYADLSLPQHHADLQDCSKGLMRYGNEKVGLWGSVPHSSPADWIVKRLEWVTPKESPSSAIRRRGPVAIVDKKPWLYNSGDYKV